MRSDAHASGRKKLSTYYYHCTEGRNNEWDLNGTPARTTKGKFPSARSRRRSVRCSFVRSFVRSVRPSVAHAPTDGRTIPSNRPRANELTDDRPTDTHARTHRQTDGRTLASIDRFSFSTDTQTEFQRMAARNATAIIFLISSETRRNRTYAEGE